MPSIFETDVALDKLAMTAITRTKELMEQSDKLRDRREKANRKRVARLFKDPKAIEATITLTDEGSGTFSQYSTFSLYGIKGA